MSNLDIMSGRYPEDQLILSIMESNHSEREKNEDRHDKDRHSNHKRRRKHEDGEDESYHRKHKTRKKGKDREKHRDRSGERKMEVVDGDLKDGIWRERDITEEGERVRLNISCDHDVRWFSFLYRS